MDEKFIQLMVKKIREHPNGWLNGFEIFNLYSTYGIPIPAIRRMCDERRVYFDESGIRAELKCAYGWNEEKIELFVRNN